MFINNHIALTLIFALPQISIASLANFGNRTQTRALDVQPFPPSEPVEVDVTAEILNDGSIAISIPVTINDIEFSLQFDTGTGGIWVMTDAVTGQEDAGKPTLPSNGVDVPDCPITIDYDDHTVVTGAYTPVSVQVGTCTRDPYQVLAVTEMEDDGNGLFSESALSGIFGASPLQKRVGGPEPWLSGTKFSLDLRELALSSSGEAVSKGKLTFGNELDLGPGAIELDPGTLTTWMVSSKTFERVLLDCGSPVLELPADFVDEYIPDVKVEMVENKGLRNWVVDCDVTLPNMQFYLGGQMVEIEGSLLVERPLPDLEEGRCYLLIDIYNTDDDYGEVVIGLPFFFGHVVTFDPAGRKIAISSK